MEPDRVREVDDPGQDSPSQAVGNGDRSVGPSHYKARVMIVDDIPGNVGLLAAYLPEEQYEVVRAYGGKEALEKVGVSRPDLILLDVIMPEVDGYEVARRLKNDPKTTNIPIIMITALNGAEEKARGLKAGADEFLTKPVNRDEILTRVRSMLRLRQFREQLSIRTASIRDLSATAPAANQSDKRAWPQRVLLVGNVQQDITMLQKCLGDTSYELSVVRTGEEAISVARYERVDLVLLDAVLPGIDGYEVCRRLRDEKAARSIQIAILTSVDDFESKEKAVEAGADDYLARPIDGREVRLKVKSLLRRGASFESLRLNYEKAVNNAITDGLTGLYNHAYFKSFLVLELKKSLRHGYPVALIMLDIDDFKKYNDRMGHLTGDIILRELGPLITKNVRETDLAARYGGEEFAVILPYAGNREAYDTAERIRRQISCHTFIQEASSLAGRITVSLGIASYPSDADTVRDLIYRADLMLLKAKRDGKNRICVFEPDNP